MMQKGPQDRYQTPSQAIVALKGVAAAPAKQQTAAAVPKKAVKPAIVWGLLLVCAVIIGAVVALMMPHKKGREPAVAKQAQFEPEIVQPDSIKQDSVVPSVRETGDTGKLPQAPKKIKKVVQEQPIEAKKSVAGRDPVLIAVKTGDTEGLLRLLSEGGSPNGLSGAGTATPLHEAVRRGSADQVRILTERGANPNIRDNKGDTPLHYALKEDAQLIVRELLKHGADPNVKDHLGKTPLQIAESVSSELESMVKQYGGR
jgi:hypothetical protein